jgi:hypothetical protein
MIVPLLCDIRQIAETRCSSYSWPVNVQIPLTVAKLSEHALSRSAEIRNSMRTRIYAKPEDEQVILLAQMPGLVDMGVILYLCDIFTTVYESFIEGRRGALGRMLKVCSSLALDDESLFSRISFVENMTGHNEKLLYLFNIIKEVVKERYVPPTAFTSESVQGLISLDRQIKARLAILQA